MMAMVPFGARRSAAAAVLGVLLAWMPVAAKADAHLPAIFSDHMVVQASKPVVVWGKAAPGETVSVSFAGHTATATAKEDGRWQTRLGPTAKGGPHELSVRAGNEIVIKDVLVGEVWLGSGQSNMELPMKSAADPEKEIAAADHPTTRLFKVKPLTREQPADDVVGQWQVCSPESVAEFSAVLYHFGREIADTQATPVGLIESAYGGTSIEAWMRPSVLASCEEGRASVARFNQEIANFDTNNRAYLERVEGWKKRVQAAEAAGKTPPRKPPAPLKRGDRKTPSGLYNAMIHPIVPYTLRGFLWYQGEKNARFFAFPYRALFPRLIADWRTLWGDPTLPFDFVQLPNLIQVRPQEHDWPTMRESQAEALQLPNTGMAVTIDIGDPHDVHPKNKREVGRRLALIARARTYGERIAFSGPVYRTTSVDDSSIVVRFLHADQGLVSQSGGTLSGFEVAGADGKFSPVDASIAGPTVRLNVPGRTGPFTVRYAWKDNPSASLFNADGLPAAPFRASVAADSLFEESLVFPAAPRDRPNYRIPAIIRSPGGDLLVFAEKRNLGPGDLGDHDLVLKRSQDRGRTWSHEQLLFNGGRLSNVDSTPLVDRDTGAIFLFFLLNKQKFAYLRSDDDGRNWTQPIVIHDAVVRPDWEKLGTDQRYGVGPGSGAVQLRAEAKRGRLLVPARHREFVTNKATRTFSHAFYSDDHGKSWHLGGTAARDGNECQLAELVDGKVMIIMRDGDNTRRPDRLRQLIALSSDGGETWAEPYHDETLVNPQVEACIMRFTTTPQHDKNRLIFSNPKSPIREEVHPYGRYNVSVRISEDEGKTWTAGKTIYPGPSSYTNLAILDDMSIGMAYECGPAGSTSYWSEIRFARFNLEWLTDGRDSLPHR